MQAILAKSYAKINLLLNITGQRPDGYHTLDGVMIPVSLYDTVRIAKSHILCVTCDDKRISSGVNNTASKAAEAFFQLTGLKGGAEIFIQKRIPHEAGLGGGSSNAACVLLALNHLYGTDLSHEALTQIASRIGADVPFFLQDGAKRAQGIGDELQSIDYRLDYPFILIKPKNGVNTASAYRLFNHTAPEPADVPACIHSLAQNNIDAFIKHSKNMLQHAGIQLCNDVAVALDVLMRNGALFAQMTGSGSAVYGLFNNEEAQKKAADILAALNQFETVMPVRYCEKTYEEILVVN